MAIHNLIADLTPTGLLVWRIWSKILPSKELLVRVTWEGRTSKDVRIAAKAEVADEELFASYLNPSQVMKKQILVVLVLGIIIAGSIGYLIGHKKAVVGPAPVIQPVATGTETVSSATTSRQSTPITNSNPSSISPKTSDSVYTTKIGIKIPYPKEYSFSTKSRLEIDPLKSPSVCTDGKTHVFQIDDKFIAGDITLGHPVDCITKQNRGSEFISFGFEKNTETVEIDTSDTSFYYQNTCEIRSKNVSYEMVKISGQDVYHITTVGGLETYCLSTPGYTFLLNRNQSNKVKIDVSKIIFPN